MWYLRVWAFKSSLRVAAGHFRQSKSVCKQSIVWQGSQCAQWTCWWEYGAFCFILEVNVYIIFPVDKKYCDIPWSVNIKRQQAAYKYTWWCTQMLSDMMSSHIKIIRKGRTYKQTHINSIYSCDDAYYSNWFVRYETTIHIISNCRVYRQWQCRPL